VAKLEDSFFLALDALKPYLPDIVISGGWVPFVYHAYLDTPKPKERPLKTNDVDITVPMGLKPGQRPSLRKLLEAGDFEERRKMPMIPSEQKGPEETIYEVSKNGVDIELTFLAPRIGMDKRPAAELPSGVVATLLPYVRILLASTMPVRISGRTSQGQEIDLEATIPTPEAYCYQKGLSFVTRASRAKKAKDLYYLFDLLANYPELRKRSEAGIPKLQASFPSKWYARFLADLDAHFRTPESEGAMLVEEQRPGGGSDPAFRARVCRTFQDFLKKLRENA
jgi:hypothetical protein